MTDATPNSSPEAGAGAPDARVAKLEDDLRAAEAQVADLTDRLKRLAADFDNHRKRSRRDTEDAREGAREEMLRDLLAVSDNFDRAFHASGSEEALYEGVRLIYKQFQDLLARRGLERIDAVGFPFDPLVHEAVMREVTDAYADGTVIQEFERGYRYRGKVLRAAKVKVAAAPPPPPPPSSEPGETPPPGDQP